MKNKFKYKINDNIYFIRTQYIEIKNINVGNKNLYISTKIFNYIWKGSIYNRYYHESLNLNMYNIKDNYGFNYTICENHIYKNEKKALSFCKKKNKYTYKDMCKELKELKKIIG